MPMVSYWKTKQSTMAKVTTGKDGALVMKFEGESEEFPGFPRGYILFAGLSKLKHELKNQIFNEAWAKLEQGLSHEEIIQSIKSKLTGELDQYLGPCRYDMVPPSRMIPVAKELWRVLSKMEQQEPKLRFLKETLTFLMNEDDAYRFRFQWFAELLRPRWYHDPLETLKLALEELEQAEIVRDMKDKIKLLKRILLLIMEDPKINQLFQEFCKEVDWNKLKLTKADKYHFRGKWFKVDNQYFEY